MLGLRIDAGLFDDLGPQCARTPFDLYLQPGEKHAFAGEAARLYLTQRLLEFFKQNL
jgi:hypothetical protein